MEIGLVRQVDIDHEMQQSYLDYAMSVIVSRALPDARDGMKPVQRRILYAMYDMGLRPESSYKKSARIVGEVLGKYHPHGDLAVYEAMARMAQDFSMRNALVDGQGNFGSIDGDPPAAMRYTEARLTPAAMEMLNQLDRNTVDYVSNFDETLREPEVLPAAIPNLLVNGGSGIAVGMATSIPPHNLSEIIDGCIYLLKHWDNLDDVSVTDLMELIKGPDFPTGGIILQESDRDDLLSAYATGRGRVTLRGRVHLEDTGRGRSRIIVTELPYQTNKSALMERIAELVREGDLEGISDLRDESDRQGMRIVIELNKAAEQENILRDLYRRTALQSTFRISLLALVDNEPRTLSLKQALRVYLEHRLVVIRRRSEYDLKKAQQRAHILEALRTALKNLDDIIALIRKAADADTARTQLMKKYKFDEPQAQAILDMPLRRLASLERKKIEEEFKALQVTIGELEALLKSPKKMRLAVETELETIKATYSDKRRTQIVHLGAGEKAAELLTARDVTPGQDVWITVSESGLIGRTSGDVQPRLDGASAPRWIFSSNTHHNLYLINGEGRAAAIHVQSLPEISQVGEGALLHKISAMAEGDRLAAVFSLPQHNSAEREAYVLSATKRGMVKKSAVGELPGPSAQLFTLVKVNEDDELRRVLITGGNDQLLLVTALGMAIRFSEQDVRPMGLVAAGVNGMKLSEADELIGAEKYGEKQYLLLMSNNAKGWRISMDSFPVQGRYGQGVIAVKLGGARLVGIMAGPKTQSGLLQYGQALSHTVRVDVVPEVKRGVTGSNVPGLRGSMNLNGVVRIDDALSFWTPRTEPITLVKKPRAKAVQGDGKSAKSAAAEGKKPAKKEAPATPKGKASTSTAEKKSAAAPAKATNKKAAESTKAAKSSAAPAKPAKLSTKTDKPAKPTAAASRPAKPSAAPSKPAKPSAAPAKPAEKPAKKKTSAEQPSLLGEEKTARKPAEKKPKK